MSAEMADISNKAQTGMKHSTEILLWLRLTSLTFFPNLMVSIMTILISHENYVFYRFYSVGVYI